MTIINDIVILKNLTDKAGRKYDHGELSEFLNDVFYGTIGTNHDVTIDMSKVSHVVKNLRIEDNDLIGDIHILETPMGLMLSELLENDTKIVTNVRSFGVIDEQHNVSKVALIGIDIDMPVGVGTQRGFINLLAPDKRS